MPAPTIVSFWAGRILDHMIQESLKDTVPPTLSPEELECNPDDPSWERDVQKEIQLYHENWHELCRRRNNS